MKRKIGIITDDGKWLVLTESTRDEGNNTWIHKCGAVVRKKVIIRPIHDFGFGQLAGGGNTEAIIIPFCPNCEE